jgi:MFS family permease
VDSDAVRPASGEAARRGLAQQPGAAALGIRGQALLSAMWLGLSFQSAALLPIVVPAQLLVLVDQGSIASTQQALALSVLSTVAAIIAVVVTPLAGSASDELKRRSGTRRQLIIAGIVIAVAGQLGLAATLPLWIFLGGFVLMQVGTNAATAAYQGLLPDLVRASQRGAASGWLGLMTLIGSVGSLAVAGLLLGSVSQGAHLATEVRAGSAVFYITSALVLFVCAAATVAGVAEPSARPQVERGGWLDALRHRPFRVVFAARALVMIGLTLFLTYIEYYLAQVGGETTFVGATVIVALLALGSALLSSLLFGIVSDRMSRVTVVVVANMLMAAAALIFVAAPAGFPLAPLAILFGLGYGAYLSVDWALAIDSLPAAGATARDLGIFTVSINLPTLIAPAVGGMVILAAGALGLSAIAYRLVFMVAALALLGGILVVRRVRFA